MEKIGPLELIIILVIVIMIFGVGKLPQAAGSLGKAMREFRKESARTDDSEDEVAPKKKRRKTVQKASTAKAKDEETAVVKPTQPAKAALPVTTTVEEKAKPQETVKPS
jgi:sec-independent protein translocase protein TatA